MVQTLGRWLWIGFALAIAITAAFIFLPIALFSDPMLREIGSALAADGIEALITLFFDPDMIAGYAGGIVAIIWLVLIAICIAPVTIIAVLGEAAGIRTILWYGLATALLAGAMPWILRAANSSKPASAETGKTLAQTAELRIAMIFALTGLAAGAVYWLVAGRSTGVSARNG